LIPVRVLRLVRGHVQGARRWECRRQPLDRHRLCRRDPVVGRAKVVSDAGRGKAVDGVQRLLGREAVVVRHGVVVLGLLRLHLVAAAKDGEGHRGSFKRAKAEEGTVSSWCPLEQAGHSPRISAYFGRVSVLRKHGGRHLLGQSGPW